MPKFNDSTDITLPVRNLIALVIATAISATAYFEIQGRLTHLEFQQEVIWSKVRASEEYRNTFNPLEAVEKHISKQYKLELLLNNLITRLEYIEKENENDN